jgi:hypothetical protein
MISQNVMEDVEIDSTVVCGGRSERMWRKIGKDVGDYDRDERFF